MSDPGQETPPASKQSEAESRRGALIGLIVVALLVVIAYFLVTALRKNADLQDCLMSGRKNCVPIEVPTHK